MNKFLIVLLGPTGVGKTDLSIELAEYFHTDIISSDSRQIYKELSIGTAVPTREQLNMVTHHLIQVKSIHDYYNVSMFEQDVLHLLNDLFLTKDHVFLVGGSGMYIDAVCNGIDDIPDIDIDLRNSLIERMEVEGIESFRMDLKKLDPEFYASADLRNKQRILRAMEVCLHTGKPFSSFKTKHKKERDFKIIKIGLDRNREELYERINLRVDMMIQEGLIQEAEKVFPYKGLYALKTVGYRELFDALEGKISIEEAVKKIKDHSRSYARRQLTWFRRDKQIQWFHPEDKEGVLKFIKLKVESL